jgi:hypothetical protein
MKHDNPFAKLGALDQKLYQDTAPQPPETPVPAGGTSAKRRPSQKERATAPRPSTPRPVKTATPAHRDTTTPRHHDTMQPRNHDTTTPLAELDIVEVVRKAVKQIGKEAATHRFTLDEKNLLADIEYTYKRQGIRTSENEITRIAINYFIEDYRKNGEQSLLATILKRLNS